MRCLGKFARSTALGCFSAFACFSALAAGGSAAFAAELGGTVLVAAGAQLTPLAAIQARANLHGMRLREIRWDAVLRQNWAVLEDVEHPERPLWSERADSSVSSPDAPSGGLAATPVASGVAPTPIALPAPVPPPFQPRVAVIHYGDRVRLWRIEKNVRIEMIAVAETYAAVGEEVKLRIPGSGTDGDGGWRVVGIVRGPGDVEMEP